MRRAGRWLGCAALALVASASRATDPEGTWYLLIHYQDASSPDPGAWHWEDHVWDFQRQGEALLWVDYELVTFMDVRGRFAGLRTAWARRVAGAWEPTRGQQREIERGLFVNPRGSHTLLLEPSASGWASAAPAGDGAVDLGLSLRRSASIEQPAGLPRFSVSQTLLSPGEVQRVAEAVYRTESRGRDGRLEGEYRSGSRSGRFRLLPSKLRDRVRPEIRRVGERLVLKPDSVGQWSNLLPALLRPWRYARSRVVEIETIPPGAMLDLSYLRDGARRLFEQTRAPVTLVLPTRFVARPSDAVQIDAFAPGFAAGRRLLRVQGDERRLEIELEPGRNALERVWFRALGDEATLVLFTAAPLDLRSGRDAGSLTLVLNDTLASEPAADFLGALSAPPVAKVRVIQLGADAILRFELEGEEVPEPTFFRTEGFLPGDHRTRVRIPRPASEAGWEARAREAAAEVTEAELEGCAIEFEASLLAALAADEVARSLTFPDDRVRELLRAALLRLAASDPEGAVHLTDRSRLRVGAELQLEAALSRPQEVRGLVAALRATLRRVDGDWGESLRGVLVPGQAGAWFDERLASAREAEQRCRAGLQPSAL